MNWAPLPRFASSIWGFRPSLQLGEDEISDLVKSHCDFTGDVWGGVGMLWKGDHFEHCNDFGPPSIGSPSPTTSFYFLGRQFGQGGGGCCRCFLHMYVFSNCRSKFGLVPISKVVQANASRLDSSSSSFEYWSLNLFRNKSNCHLHRRKGAYSRNFPLKSSINTILDPLFWQGCFHQRLRCRWFRHH